MLKESPTVGTLKICGLNKSQTKPMTKFNNKSNGQTSWWPIKQYRFKTENHPALTGKGKAGALVVSANELKMMEGLVNILGCKTQAQAMKIALYEALYNPQFDILDNHKKEAKAGATTRNKKATVTITKSVRAEYVYPLMERLGMTEKETLRLVLISFCRGIRSDVITSLATGKLVSQKQLQNEWKAVEGNNTKKGKLGALRESHKAAWEEAAEEGQEIDKRLYVERGLFIEAEGLQHLYESDGYGNTTLDVATVDNLMALDKRERILASCETPEEIREALVFSYMDSGLSEEDANLCVDEEMADEHQLTEEELEHLEADMDELFSNAPPTTALIPDLSLEDTIDFLSF